MAHQYEVLRSSLIHEDTILALRTDVVTMPGGGQASRVIVEHFGAVAVVAVNENHEIALIHQYRHSVGQRLWELPAGLLDDPKESALECAQRELYEETGMRAASYAHVLDTVTSPGFAEEVVRIFMACDLTIEQAPQRGDEEAELEVTWVPLDTARTWVFEGKIVNSIAIAGILAVHDHIAGEVPLGSADAAFPLRPHHLVERKHRAVPGFGQEQT